IGDATVPMHVAATAAWGHRPFEDGTERLWWQIRRGADANGQPVPDAQQAAMARDILTKAFAYRQTIVSWRNANPGIVKGIPIRQIVTTVAANTGSYSMNMQPQTGWPFSALASGAYIFGDDKGGTGHYENFPNAVGLYYPVWVDGSGATLAVLTAASEVLP